MGGAPPPPAAGVLAGLGPTLTAPVPPVLPSHGPFTPEASWPCGRAVAGRGVGGCPSPESASLGPGRTGARGRREPCAGTCCVPPLPADGTRGSEVGFSCPPLRISGSRLADAGEQEPRAWGQDWPDAAARADPGLPARGGPSPSWPDSGWKFSVSGSVSGLCGAQQRVPLHRSESGSAERRDPAGAVQPGRPVGAAGTGDRTAGGLRWERGAGPQAAPRGRTAQGWPWLELQGEV